MFTTCRYFFGDSATGTSGGSLIYGLERNWQGDAAENSHVMSSLEAAGQLQRTARLEDNQISWRVLAYVFRAHYDAYTQARLQFEQHREAQAYQAIALALLSPDCCNTTVAERTLKEPFDDGAAAQLMVSLHRLAAAINSSTALCGGCAAGGMAVLQSQSTLLTLDTIATPLADQAFLLARLHDVARERSADAKRAILARLVGWTDPGPGGFYDSLGSSPRNSRLDPGAGPAADPQFLFAPLLQFNEDPTRWPPCGDCGAGDGPPVRVGWQRWAQTYADEPLTLRYTGLDPTARYSVEIVYAYQGWGDRPVSRLYAKGIAGGPSALLHDYIAAPVPARPLAFAVPHKVTASGSMSIECSQPEGSAQGNSGRGCLIAEVWLRVTSSTPK